MFSFCLYSTKTVIELWLRVISLELMKGVAADQQLDLRGRMKKKSDGRHWKRRDEEEDKSVPHHRGIR